MRVPFGAYGPLAGGPRFLGVDACYRGTHRCKLFLAVVQSLDGPRGDLGDCDATTCGSAGKLGVLNVECDKCGRRGRYMLARLVARYGIDAKLFDWSDEITADCPRKQAKNFNDQCSARCPDLPKVV